MVIKFMTFDVEDEYLNSHPGSPPYYGPCPSFSSSDSSPAAAFCNCCLGGISGLPVAEPLDAGQQSSSSVQFQVQQSQNHVRDGSNNFLLTLINRGIRYYWNRYGNESLQMSHDKQDTLREQKIGRNRGLKGKLVIFDGYSHAFGLEDLLNASIEELGRGSHWSTYKACLESSTTVVVKRSRYGDTTTTELRKHMELLGQIRHENVAALRGYLVSRDETLMLYDFYSQGSVSSMMMRGPGSSLDWEQRWKIVIGVVRGIAYSHKQDGGKLCHGNLTSSNVFINSQGYGCISDICCSTLKGALIKHYSSPSYDARKDPIMTEASQASDIYRLGLLMLELLTGNNPWMATAASDIVSKVHYELRNGTPRFDEGLPHSVCMPMLRLALSCVNDRLDRRPAIVELAKTMENIFLCLKILDPDFQIQKHKL